MTRVTRRVDWLILIDAKRSPNENPHFERNEAKTIAMADAGFWPYSRCAHWYGGPGIPAATLNTPFVAASSAVVIPTCLHASERAVVMAGRAQGATPLFETASMRPVAPVEHTSAYALPSYCSGKVPLSHIFRAVETDERVCVWGIPDFHIVEYAYERGFIATHIETLSKRKSEPLLNRERPRLFRLQSIDDLALQTQRRGEAPGGIPCEASRGFLVLAVFPGCDYVFHYARMVMLVMESSA